MTADAESIMSAAKSKWESQRSAAMPPPSDVLLWQEPHRTIYVEQSFGAAVPYPPVYRPASESNYGYVRLKGNLDAVSAVPELANWPEYAELIRKVNADESPIESVGCALGFFDVDDERVKHKVGSYLDVVFSEPQQAESFDANLMLAAKFAAALNEPERYWYGLELAIQRLRALPHAVAPLCLMIRLSAYGRTQDEARTQFRIVTEHVGIVVRNLATNWTGGGGPRRW